MSSPFLYFCPGLQRDQLLQLGSSQANLALLHARGLSEISTSDVQGGGLAATQVAKGPDGQSGTIVVHLPLDRSRRQQQSYIPDQQTWVQATDELWVGMDERPEPEDLIRPRTYRGYSLELGDGNRWEIPVVRRPDHVVQAHGVEATNLPRQLYWDGNGKLQTPLLDCWQGLWEDSAAICDLFYSDENMYAVAEQCDLGWALTECEKLLGVNYRIGRHEQRLLGLIDTTNYSSVLGAAVDVPLIWQLMEDAKKNKQGSPEQPGGVSSGNGGTAAGQATVPVAVNSG